MSKKEKAWDLILKELSRKFIAKWGENNMLHPAAEFQRALQSTKTVWDLISIIQTFRLTKKHTLGECQEYIFKVIEDA